MSYSNVSADVNDGRKKGTKIYAGGGCVVIKKIFKSVGFTQEGGNKSVITGFSHRSGQRMRKYLRACVTKYTHMLTLTYPFSYPSDGKTVKLHLKAFCRWLDRQHEINAQLEGSTDKFSAFWFLEFQERGAPHFHIFTNFMVDYKAVARKWYEVVGSDDERHLRAGTRTERLKAGRGGTISYASKYAAKACQKVAPEGYENVGRFWGVYGCREIVAADTAFNEQNFDLIKSNYRKIKDYIKEAETTKGFLMYRREKGVLVCFIANRELFKKIQRQVWLIECKVNHYSSIFKDADIE